MIDLAVRRSRAHGVCAPITGRTHCVGVKVRQGGFQVGENGTKPLQLAVQAGEWAGVPVMTYTSPGGVPIVDVLALLRPGELW